MRIDISEEQAYEARRAIEAEIRRANETMTTPYVDKMPALKERAMYSARVLSEVLTMLAGSTETRR